MPKCNSCCTFLLHFGTRAYLLSPGEGSCCIFSTRNNCCEFLASYGAILQNDTQPCFKMPVSSAALSYLHYLSKIFKNIFLRNIKKIMSEFLLFLQDFETLLHHPYLFYVYFFIYNDQLILLK